MRKCFREKNRRIKVLFRGMALLVTAMLALFLVHFFADKKSVSFQDSITPMQSEALHEHEITYYTENYPGIYKEELQCIFGDTLQIGKKRTIEVEGEYCDCGISSNGYVYDEWDLTYQDEQGRTFTVCMDNRGLDSISEWQIKWLLAQLETYYMEEYVWEYFEDGVLETEEHKTYCKVKLISGFGVGSSDEVLQAEIDQKKIEVKKYYVELLEKLSQKEYMICLPGIDYDNIFHKYPIYADFFLSISVLEGSTEEKEEYELALEETLFSMVDALNKDTKNEKIVPRHEEHLYFCLDVYDVYRESFW